MGDTLEFRVMSVSHTIDFPTTLQDVLDLANEEAEERWGQRTYEDLDLFDNWSGIGERSHFVTKFNLVRHYEASMSVDMNNPRSFIQLC